jgi:Fe-Mn family superoxide dismutase
MASVAGAAALSGLRLEAQGTTPPAGGTTAAPPPPAPPAPTGPFTLPPLPYAYDALEPHIDAQTMMIHHDKHHAAYVMNLNKAVAGKADVESQKIEDLVAKWEGLPQDIRSAVRNNGGGHLNHSLFWPSLKKGGGGAPTGELLKGIEGSFGTWAKFQETLAATAVALFGSGWAWMSFTPAGGIGIEVTANQDSPLYKKNIPLFGIDVWEHAYYLKYQNQRKEYVDAVFNVVNWDTVAERYNGAKAKMAKPAAG